MRRIKILIPLVASMILSSGNMSAQAAQNGPLEFELQIDSKRLNEIRTISIALPDDYYSTENTYPATGTSHPFMLYRYLPREAQMPFWPFWRKR